MSANFPVRDGKIVLDGVQRKTDAQAAIIEFLVHEGAVILPSDKP